MPTIEIRKKDYVAQPDPILSMGDIIIVDGEVTILSQVAPNELRLVSLRSGNRMFDSSWGLRNTLFSEVKKSVKEEMGKDYVYTHISMKNYSLTLDY